MAKKRSAGKKSTRDLPVKSAGKVKGGSALDSHLGTMSDLSSESQYNLQQAATQSAQAYTAASNALRKASDSQTATIKNMKG
jgi:hypothetical protein